MLQLSGAITNRPVMSLRTGDEVATALAPIINPNNLKIEGWYCIDRFNKGQLVLLEAGLIEHELEDVLDDPQAVTVVEWSGVIQHVLPKQRLTITLERSDNDGRTITIEGPNELNYLVKDIA